MKGGPLDLFGGKGGLSPDAASEPEVQAAKRDWRESACVRRRRVRRPLKETGSRLAFRNGVEIRRRDHGWKRSSRAVKEGKSSGPTKSLFRPEGLGTNIESCTKMNGLLTSFEPEGGEATAIHCSSPGSGGRVERIKAYLFKTKAPHGTTGGGWRESGRERRKEAIVYGSHRPLRGCFTG